MELFGYASLIGVGLLLGMMRGAPAGRDSKFSTILWHLFIFSIPISRLSLSLVWQGHVGTGFSEISVCGGRAPRERRRENAFGDTLPVTLHCKIKVDLHHR